MSVNHEPNVKNRWSLTEETLNGLLQKLSPNPEQAARIYESIRKKMIKFFEWRGCLYPEEYADHAIDRLAKRIHDAVEIKDPQKYIGGVAFNVLMEYWRETKTTVSSDEIVLADGNTLKDRQTEDSRLERVKECLTQCLNKLPSNTRELILQYYQEEKGEKIRRRKEMTGTENISLNALRIRALRIRRKVQECIEWCLQQRPENE